MFFLTQQYKFTDNYLSNIEPQQRIYCENYPVHIYKVILFKTLKFQWDARCLVFHGLHLLVD